MELQAIEEGLVFIAMPMAKNFNDTHDAIVEAASNCGLVAKRIDDDQSNERITKRMMDYLHRCEFVVADLTGARPNVFYEAGYAEGQGKIPVYIAREGTALEFDVKDYTVIFFDTHRQLKLDLADRFRALIAKRGQLGISEDKFDIRKEVDRLERQLRGERAARERMEKKNAPRRLTAEDIEDARKAFSGFEPNGVVVSHVVGDNESMKLAEDLKAMFLQMGWPIGNAGIVMAAFVIGGMPDGVSVNVRPQLRESAGAKAVVAWLKRRNLGNRDLNVLPPIEPGDVTVAKADEMMIQIGARL